MWQGNWGKREHLCVSRSVHGPGRKGVKKRPLGIEAGPQGSPRACPEPEGPPMPVPGGLPSLKTTTGWRMHLGLHPASPRPPSHHPAPSCFDGRKNFQLFPSLFFQTGDSLGKGIPPSPNHPGTYVSMPRIQAHPVVLRITVIFGCLTGVVPQGRAYGGAQLPSPSPHAPPWSLPTPSPSSLPASEGGKEARV